MTAADGLMGVIGLRVPGSLAYRHLAIRFVTTACKIALESVTSGTSGTSGASPGDENDDFVPEVVSAFGEAFNNIAMHGFRDVTPQPVQIEIDWDLEKFTITMIDLGSTFDPASIAPPDFDAMPESGMGFFIMTSCMDVVDYQPGPPNVLRLVKLRQRAGLLPPAPLGHQNDSDLADPITTARATGSLAALDLALGPERLDVALDGRLDDDEALGDRCGDRGSGIVEIAAAVDSAPPPGDASRSVWRMKAVRTVEEPREMSRRK